MSRNKKTADVEKREALFWKERFGFAQLEDIPVEIEHVDLRASSITDEELGFIASRVKNIGMLDLHETNISNTGIAHLVNLDSLRELRLKSNQWVDNACMKFINEITSLAFLYLKFTQVNVDGLFSIPLLTNLRTVIITDEIHTVAAIEEKMTAICKSLPDCEIWVNGKDFFRIRLGKADGLADDESNKLYHI